MCSDISTKRRCSEGYHTETTKILYIFHVINERYLPANMMKHRESSTTGIKRTIWKFPLFWGLFFFWCIVEQDKSYWPVLMWSRGTPSSVQLTRNNWARDSELDTIIKILSCIDLSVLSIIYYFPVSVSSINKNWINWMTEITLSWTSLRVFWPWNIGIGYTGYFVEITCIFHRLV